MKRALVIAVVIAATTAGATLAEAAAKKGKFRGATSAGDPIGLKVDRHHRVRAFFYDGVTLDCSDGDSFDTPSGRGERVQTPAKVHFEVGDNRRWGITARNHSTGFAWDVSARFNRKGTKTHGTLAVSAKFNEDNQQDPNGSITCESGKLDFKVKRR